METILKEHIIKTDTEEIINKAKDLAEENNRCYGTVNTPARFYDYGTEKEFLKKYSHPGILVKENTPFWTFRSLYALETARRMLKK